MKNPESEQSTGRLGTLLVAGLFVVVGVVTLYDTTRYGDLDAKVFPRAAAIVLILSSILIILVSLLRPVKEAGFGRAHWWRRILLIACMLVACLLMPRVGFLPAGFIAFAGSMLAAQHEHWNKRTIVTHAGAGIIIMVGFYALFRFALNVPLP